MFSVQQLILFICLGDQIEETAVGGAYGGEERCIQGFGAET